MTIWSECASFYTPRPLRTRFLQIQIEFKIRETGYKRSIKKIRAGTVKQGSMSVMFDWVLVKLWRSPARRRTRKSERRLQGSKTVIGVCIVNIAHILLHYTPIKIELILFD